MRLTFVRFIIFCFSLMFGIAVSSVLAEHYRSVRPLESYARARQGISDNEPATPPRQESDAQPVTGFESLGVIGSGSAGAKTIKLRESPEADASVSAILKLADTERVEILGATRDYLRVRFLAANAPPDDKQRERDLEGWVSWDEVVPDMSAIVIEAKTGEVVSRLPFNDGGSIAASFSPDNSRAIFYDDHQAYEVRTEDYTLLRSFGTQSRVPASATASYFYGTTDKTLYAALHSTNYARPASETLLNIVRVENINGPTSAPELSELASGFALSADGRTGFILHSSQGEKDSMLVDILNLQELRVSNTLTLRGENLPTSTSQFVVSADGAELYATLFPSRNVISVIDTHTGRQLREIPFASSLKEQAQYLTQDDLVVNSLFLFHFWDEEGGKSQHLWLDAGKTSSAERGIVYAVEAGGERFSVNGSGTRLFKLDANNHISRRYWIDRPDLRFDPNDAEMFTVFNLLASPDGKYLIVVLGMPSGC
ncbi:MAG TPA: hypothetical protein VGC64_05880 [Pyrinomonadaceae bacterium]|jgi:hypothetical protein